MTEIDYGAATFNGGFQPIPGRYDGPDLHITPSTNRELEVSSGSRSVHYDVVAFLHATMLAAVGADPEGAETYLRQITINGAGRRQIEKAVWQYEGGAPDA